MNRFNWLGVVVRGALRAIHLRALLLWWASLSAVALVAALPMFGLFNRALSHTAGAVGYAHALDLNAITDVMGAAGRDGAPRWGIVAALLFTVLLWPWLTGVMVAAVRLGRGTRLFVLAGEGMREYGRQLRLMLWSIIPMAPFVAIGVWLIHVARQSRFDAIVPSTVTWHTRGALVAAVLLFLLPYVLTELTRARIGTRDDSRSVVVHWWRALKVYVRRPLAAWITSLMIGLLGLLVLAALGLGRLDASGAGWGPFVMALLLTQLTTVAMGWLRLARLHVLAQLVDNDAARRAA